MPFWLFKEEPTCYSFDELERDGKTAWEGVKNPLALKYLRQCQAGDLVAFYHTGKEKSVVGVMEVVRAAKAEAEVVSVTVEPKSRLEHAVPLSVIKCLPEFAESELVRNSRLSVMPLTSKQWNRIVKLGHKPL